MCDQLDVAGLRLGVKVFVIMISLSVCHGVCIIREDKSRGQCYKTFYVRNKLECFSLASLSSQV